MKTEPEVFSFDDLKARPGRTEPWDGIRNYQARNFMRDAMKKGDPILFYHSNAGPETGVVGVAAVASDRAYPDPTAWDPNSPYYDPKSGPDNPRWAMVDVVWREPFKRLVALKELKAEPELADMLVVRRGQRLSIQPVEPRHFRKVCEMGGLAPSRIERLGA